MSLIEALTIEEQSRRHGGSMSRRRRRKAARAMKRSTEKTQQPGEVPLERPIGPGMVAEIEDHAEGSVGSIKVYRNRNEHPLTLAFFREKLHGSGQDALLIARRRFGAGEQFRIYYEARNTQSRNNYEPRLGGGDPTTLSDAVLEAGRRLARIEQAMGASKDYAVIENFCGKGHSMIDALRLAEVPFAPQGVVPRVCEALDVLVRVLNRPLPALRRAVDS